MMTFLKRAAIFIAALAVVVLAGDTLHPHTFELEGSFGCDEYEVWLPVVQ